MKPLRPDIDRGIKMIDLEEYEDIAKEAFLSSLRETASDPLALARHISMLSKASTQEAFDYYGAATLLNFKWDVSISHGNGQIYWRNPQEIVFLEAPNPIQNFSHARELVDSKKYYWWVNTYASHAFKASLFSSENITSTPIEETKDSMISPGAALCYVLLQRA